MAVTKRSFGQIDACQMVFCGGATTGEPTFFMLIRPYIRIDRQHQRKGALVVVSGGGGGPKNLTQLTHQSYNRSK